jgi:hypothetical protein
MIDEARTHGCTELRRDVEILLANHTWHVAAVLVSPIRLRPLHCPQNDPGVSARSKTRRMAFSDRLKVDPR